MRSRSIAGRSLMRQIMLPHLVVALILFGTTAAAFAQDVEHGRRVAERWCAACHAIATGPTRFNRALPFAAIAARQDVSSEMLTAFLLLPHATMPNLPLSQQDAADLAAFIMDMKK